MSSNTAMFQGAKNVSIDGGTFIVNSRRTTSEEQGLPGIHRLIHSKSVSWSSLYNSSTRMNEASQTAVNDAVGGWHRFLEYAATSRPNFDQSVDDAINAIFSWVTNPSTESLIMWVHDDDRRITSFIAQVVAYLLADRRQLSATYFFDSNTDRNTVVPTLVHEFTVRYRHDDILLDEISKVIESSPVGVFTQTPREQISRLLTGPLRAVSEADPHRESQDGIILLHAYEDCGDEGDFQETLLSALLDALLFIKANTAFPQRLLIIGKRTDRLEDYLMGRLASRSPILQRPVQSQLWIKKDQDLRQKTIELARREDKIWRSLLAIQDKEEKMQQEHRRQEEECDRIITICSRKEQEMAEREKMVQERENKLCEKEESFDQKSKALKKKESALRNKENDIKMKEEELANRVVYVPSEDIPISPTIPGPQPPLLNSPIQEPGVQEDARMISPASEGNRSDRIIILMGPLIPQKSDFIDCLTRCVNPWRYHPSTSTSNQFFDSLDDNLGKGRFWVKAVRTQRSQPHSTLFVDFPSLGDDDLATAKILENIVVWLNAIHKNEISKIAGILYFHPLLESESRGPSYRNLRALGQICGDKAAKKVIFVFQKLSPSTTRQRAEAFFQQHYGHLMKKLGAEFDYFDNTATSGWRIVDRLLGPQSEDVSLLLQDELILLKRPLHETYVARRLYVDLIARHTEKLKAHMGRSDRANDHRNRIQSELERLQRLQLNRSQITREPSQFPKPVNFPDLISFPETD